MGEIGTRPSVERLLVHARFVRAVARGLVADEALASDLEQETWLAALRSPPRTNPRGWFRAVARNLSYRVLRSRDRRERRERAASRPEAVPSALDLAARDEVLREVVEAVLSLDDLHREVILLRFYEDLGPAAIAARLGVPRNTVRSRLSRALAELRRRLDRRHDGRRAAWALPVSGLAGLRGPGPATSTGAGAGAAVVAGVVMGAKAKVAAAAALAVLLLGGAWWATRALEEGTRAPGPEVAEGTGGSAMPEVPGRSGREARPEGADPLQAAGPATPTPAGEPPEPESPRITVTGVVVNESGRPVGRAAVTLGVIDPRTRTISESVEDAGADGTFRLAVPSLECQLWADAVGYLPSPPVSVRAVQGEERSVRLELLGRAGVLEGRVLDGTGLPLPGATVGAVLPTGMPRNLPAFRHTQGPTTITDDLGRFRIERFPAGVRTEVYAIDHGGRVWAPGHLFESVEPGETKEIEIRLREGARLSGTIRDAEGNPASGVQVRVPGFLWQGPVWSLTDEEGRYRSQALMPYAREVTADGGRRGRASGTVDLVEGEETRWDAVLAVGTEMHGRLLDAEGNPLVGWQVLVRPDPLPFGKSGQATTDDEGRFRIGNLDDRAYRLLVAEGTGRIPALDLRGVRPLPEGVDLTLPDEARAPSRVRGRLIDDRGNPVPGTLVSVLPDAESWYGYGSCALDPDTGRFEGGPFPPGRYRIRLLSETYGYRDLGVHELPAHETVDLGTVVLDAPGSLLLGFTFQPGSPPPHVRWTLEWRRPDGSWAAVLSEEARGTRLLPCAPGDYRLRTSGTYSRPLERRFSVRSGAETRIEVSVEWVPERFVRFLPPGGAPAPDWLRARFYDGAGLLQYEGNFGRPPEGNAVLGVFFAAPGDYEAEVTPDRGSPTRVRLRVEDDSGRTQDAPIEIRLR